MQERRDVSLPPSQARSPGRHLTQRQDSQALRRCEHPFTDENSNLSANCRFSRCLAEEIFHPPCLRSGQVTFSSAVRTKKTAHERQGGGRVFDVRSSTSASRPTAEDRPAPIRA